MAETQNEPIDLEVFFDAKLADIGIKVPADSALEMIVRIEAEYLRQFQVRWGIEMERVAGDIRPVTAEGHAKLQQLREADTRIWMFDPRVTGDMEYRRT